MADRRTSSAVAAAAIPPPPPPPLPPPRQKPRSYFERFVAQPLTAYGSRPPSVQTSRADGLPNPLVPKPPGIRTGYSQDASHKTGLDITALDTNRERTHAVLAGKEILKTVRVHNAKIVDEVNLRAAVLNYTDSHVRQREGLGIHDVKWSHGQFSSHIATAAANGKVILYDLNRASVELTRLHEHTRQVHKLAFNPHQGHLLLSASHDGSVRMWDLRDMRREVTTCRSRDQYQGINGGVRDVQWSPTDAVEFAFGTDNGTIQRWDFRYNKGPKQKITAHDQRMCTSIDWHPDGKHLLSAGVDRTVKVWDFSITSRRQKAAWTLHTPYPVYRAKWRPPYWSDDFHENGAYQCTQLATSYDREHPAIHVWDFRRPFLPFREINKFATAPSDMLWHSRDALWTVGKEGVFQQNDVHHAPKTVDRRNLQALAVSPSGEVGGVAQKRPRRQFSAGLAYADDAYSDDPRDRRNSPEKSRLRSSADDSLDDSFLVSSMKAYQSRGSTSRSSKSFGSTPPSDTAPKVMFLTGSMLTHSAFGKPDQVGFRGALPGAGNPQMFAYLAQKYRAISLPDTPDLESFMHIDRVFEQNAEYAQRAGMHRLAQSWRVVGASISVATRRRAELHSQQRRLRRSAPQAGRGDEEQKPSSDHASTHDKRLAHPPNPAVRAILGTLDKSHSSSPVTTVESTSNLPTPLARPQSDKSSQNNGSERPDLLDIDQEHIDQLPPAVTGSQSHVQSSLDPNQTPAHTKFNGPQWYQSNEGLEERRALIGSYRASPRVPLSFASRNVAGSDVNVPPPLERHDSGESFAMFSASSESQKGGSVPSSSSFASGNSHPRNLQSPTNSWQVEQPHSSFGKARPPSSARDQQSGLGQSYPISPTTMPIDTGTTRSGHSDKNQQDLANDEPGQLFPFGSSERAVEDMEHLRRNNQLLRHDSSESEAYASTTTSSIDYSAEMEASGTIIAEFHEDHRSPNSMEAPNPPQFNGNHVAAMLEPVNDYGLTLSDYRAMHIDAEDESAFSVIGLLEHLIAYHTKTADAQFSSFLLLLLAPLLPQTHSPVDTPGIDVADVLNAFTETFISLGLTPTQAKAILSTQLSQLIATGINPYQAESILHTYHAQLHSLSLFNSAAELRRLAYPAYPAVYEQALKDTQIGLLCLSCKAPINNPKNKMRCETCRRAQAPCPICWSKYPAFEPPTSKKKSKSKYRSGINERSYHRRKRSSITSHQAPNADLPSTESPVHPSDWSPPLATLWTWCPLCGHGGHTNCLSTWFSDPTLSEGACPTEGCLCDCVAGQRRETKLADLAQKKAEKERAKVVRKGDDWKVGESRAVEAVRGKALDTLALGDGQQGEAGLVGGKSNGRRVRVRVSDTSDYPASGTGTASNTGTFPIGPSQGSMAASTFGKVPK
ncbi:hypothetical protein T440DRAFT_470117 [Plenodomus tracheiphilus IPT5]|uniref:Uncharacterized protein n=1 Tax=Plenodomus tracheiphilus IPT5 TaxID=1408161 RepID=A0A6A7B262_9PLEO|nr:hypothetical protein T440DRAFT_470117 [Plenodomus tracheiphilus IPT5]